jgi:hypothetical protein
MSKNYEYYKSHEDRISEYEYHIKRQDIEHKAWVKHDLEIKIRVMVELLNNTFKLLIKK